MIDQFFNPPLNWHPSLNWQNKKILTSHSDPVMQKAPENKFSKKYNCHFRFCINIIVLLIFAAKKILITKNSEK